MNVNTILLQGVTDSEILGRLLGDSWEIVCYVKKCTRMCISNLPGMLWEIERLQQYSKYNKDNKNVKNIAIDVHSFKRKLLRQSASVSSDASDAQ